MDSSGALPTRLQILAAGEHRAIPTTIPAAGRYRFQFTSAVRALEAGTPPHLSEPYVFRIEQGGSGGSN